MAMRSDITVRPARHHDISAVTGMARALAESFGGRADTVDKDAIAEHLFGGDRWAEAFVAVDAEASLIGYLTVSRRFEAHSGARTLWLGDVYVMRARRRQGVASTLLRAAARRAIALKCRALVWEVAEDNAVGRDFLAAHGVFANRLAPWQADGAALHALAEG